LNRAAREDECSAVYDAVFAHREDFGFYAWAAEQFGGPILEVGCVTGRVLIPAARAGYEVLGIDPNASRVEVCRARISAEAASLGLSADAIVEDVRDFRSDRRFRLVTTPFRSLQHLPTPADQLAALANMRDHLEPGGHLIIDVFNPSIPLLASNALREEFGDGRIHPLPDGRTVELRSRIVERDYVNQLQHAEEIYIFTFPNGDAERIVLPYTTRYTFRYEYEHMAALLGFEVEAVYGGYDRSPFGANYPGEILMVLRRPDACCS
jgi:SAM-dependent methyltransferase